jgi:hypothetical protein
MCDNYAADIMVPKLITPAKVHLALPAIAFAMLVLVSLAPANLQMVRIAQFNERLGGNYPCGDAKHNGRMAVYGENYTGGPDSIVGYECKGNNVFQRIVTGGLTREGVWAFGDGDGDSLMELVGLGSSGASVVIYESRTDTSYPTDSVWHASTPAAPNYAYPKYMDLDRDGHHEEVVFCADNTGICVFENTGDNQYSLVATLTDSEVGGAGG